MKVKIQDKATIVVLNCAFSWGNVTDKEITDETTTAKGATRGSLRVRKTLLPQASGMYVDALRTTLGSFYRGVHERKTYSTLIEGQRVMPVAFYFDYMQAFGEAKAKINAAMDALVTGYPAAVVQAQSLLGASFKQDDYPPVEELRQYLKFNVRFLPVPSGDQILNALGDGVAAEVDAYVIDVMAVAAEDAKTRLRKAVARMAENLSKKDGRIFDSMTDSIDELAVELPALAGLADDPELHSMIKEVKDTLAGYNADAFRDDKGLRTTVGAQAMEILKRMGG